MDVWRRDQSVDQEVQLRSAVFKEGLGTSMRSREQRSHRGEITRAQRSDRCANARDFVNNVPGAFPRKGREFALPLRKCSARHIDQESDAEGLRRLHAFTMPRRIKAVDQRVLRMRVEYPEMSRVVKRHQVKAG